MSDQEADLNDIYEELIKLKDTLDKIEDICQTIIEYDLEKKLSIFDNNINEIKEAIEELQVIHIRDHENIELRNDYTSQIHNLEHELSTYNKQIASLWYTYVLHPRLLKKNLTAEKNGQPCLKNKEWKLIVKNTCITIKASQLLKFYYEKKQRLKEIYETYKDQEHIEELLKDIDEEDINTKWDIWENEAEEFIKQIEEKDEIIELLKKRLQTANNNLVLLENENERLLNNKTSLLERIRLLEKNQKTTPVERANLLKTKSTIHEDIMSKRCAEAAEKRQQNFKQGELTGWKKKKEEKQKQAKTQLYRKIQAICNSKNKQIPPGLTLCSIKQLNDIHAEMTKQDMLESESKQSWTCPMCTFHNEQNMAICEICELSHSDFLKDASIISKEAQIQRDEELAHQIMSSMVHNLNDKPQTAQL